MCWRLVRVDRPGRWDVAAICGAHKKNFREWLRYNGYLPERRRSPVSGKWADFLLIDVAKAAIKHRKGD